MSDGTSTFRRRFSLNVTTRSEIRTLSNGTGSTGSTSDGRPSRLQTTIVDKKMEEVETMAMKPAPAFSLSDIPAYWDALKNMQGVGVDDRKLFLEKLILLMSKMGDKHLALKIQQVVINLLYKDLPHPPSGYLGLLPTRQPAHIHRIHEKVKYAFRQTDGSNNNPLFPTLGQAGSPYARSVPTTRIAPKSALPDPGLVFDTLLKRDKFTPHPGGMSSLFFAFADLVIHSIFNTDPTDWTVNNSSSYLDLSVLYGSNDEQLKSVRRYNGSGQLWDDVFADPRLLMMPPAACALLVLLCRNHNYIAQKLLDINENGNLKYPFPEHRDEYLRQDDEIFHRARLVNCGYFMHIILGDYVGAILGLIRDGSDWRLDPLMTMRELGHELAPVGEGNVVSVEFNLLYRWHATLSEPDSKLINDTFTRIFQGKDPATVSVSDFKQAAGGARPRTKPTHWKFGNIDRLDGRFKDEDLAKILFDATDARAGAFKARGTPESMRIIEIMSIMQSRSWATCSLNEFRKFLGLKPYSDFEEWNPDPKIHTAAAALYKDIDNLELHVGLQAEETKKPGHGAGLCPGYTISRAILADAVCLTRGDRFMTTEFTPYNLTSWGWQDCQYDTQDGSYGGLLTKLLFRTLPDHYPRGSAYAHFPFLVPEWFKNHLELNNPTLVEKYTWDRPTLSLSPTPINTYAGVKEVLSSPDFVSGYDRQLFTLTKPLLLKRLPRDTLRSAEKVQNASIIAQRALAKGNHEIAEFIFSTLEHKAKDFFLKKTEALIKEKSFHPSKGSVKYLDVVNDVINLLPVHWISHIGALPLKGSSNPAGAWTEQETYAMFADIGRYIYLNFDSSQDWHLRESAQAHTQKILEQLKARIDRLDSWFSLGGDSRPTEETMFLKKIWQHKNNKNIPHRELAAQIFSALVPTAALFSQAVTHIVDYYLGDSTTDRSTERAKFIELVKSKDAEAKSDVNKYIYEVLRLSPPVAGIYRTCAKEVDVEGIHLQVGAKVYASIANGNLDTSVFGEEANVANFSRSTEKTPVLTLGDHGLLTSKFFESTVPDVVAIILSLEGLQRGPGPSGELTSFTELQHTTKTTQYISMKGPVTPWPDSLIIELTA